MNSIMSRGIAYVIDCVCVFALFAVTQVVLFSPLRSLIGITDDWFVSGVNTEIYTIATISIPVWLYFSLLEASPWQATLGKRILRLTVADSALDMRLGFSQSLIRTIIKLLPWELAHLGNNLPQPIWYAEDPGFRLAFVFSGLLLLLYVIVICVNPKHQCIHDMLARTQVSPAKLKVG
ncbi:MAG: RDD family protein [Planctomycetaceae bacterium]|nr:RDD family protein [Planctomycetaceae bacterium]